MEMTIGICILRVQEGLDYADFFGPTMKPAGKKLYTTKQCK